MRFGFSEAQVMLRDAVREVLRRRDPPKTLRDAWEGRPVDTWTPLAEAGVFSVAAPEPAGLGLGMVDLTLALEETGRAAVPAPVVEAAAVTVPLLAALDDPRLAAAAAGTLRTTAADRRRAVDADRSDLVLAIEDGGVWLATCGDPMDTVDRGRRLFAVEVGDPLTQDPQLAADAFDRAVVGTAAQLLGLGRRMLDQTIDYVKVRTQFGRPIGSFQAVKHPLADALLGLELARPAVYRAAWSIDQGHSDRGAHASMAKALAAEAACQVGESALQCHGAIGYSFEHDLHLWMKRTWALAEAWGDPTWHRARVAQHLEL